MPSLLSIPQVDLDESAVAGIEDGDLAIPETLTPGCVVYRVPGEGSEEEPVGDAEAVELAMPRDLKASLDPGSEGTSSLYSNPA